MSRNGRDGDLDGYRGRDEVLIHAPRHGDWIQVHSGGQFWPLDPRADEVKITDIAHALSLICRFTGHTKEFYSVAQHSVLVARTVLRWLDEATCDTCSAKGSWTTEEKAIYCRDVDDRYEMLCESCYADEKKPDHCLTRAITPDASWRIALAGLLHDGSEAYICDVSRPVKMLPAMAPYREVERRVQDAVYSAFGLGFEPNIVKRADNVLLATEARDLLATLHPEWTVKPPKWPTILERIVPCTPLHAERLFLQTFEELTAPGAP